MAAPDLHAAAFPRLDDTQIAALERCAHASLRCYPNGHRVFGVGERDFKFFVVKSGAVELLDESGEKPRRVATLGPGEFTGDVAHLTGSPSLVSAVARGDCEV